MSVGGTIGDDEIILRRFPPWNINRNGLKLQGGFWRPQSNFFQPRPKEERLSVCRLLLNTPIPLLEVAVESIKTDSGKWTVAFVTVKDLRDNEVEVTFDPTEDDPGHSLLYHKNLKAGNAAGKKLRRKIAAGTVVLDPDRLNEIQNDWSEDQLREVAIKFSD